ncbi:hypothetical protein [Marinilabilia salmonicolor]|jgi:hypothetical protein|uniref:Cytochrome c domain-containing protein n=1 Tax=Marinilabilia salmonicolor TaxID=989 RepID=A0A2T0XTJ0_9BACT|nr:hypothetical protein [Marinilabilia salmonicolor]PRZ02261.1 hypothetical protein BY457_101282 [Marinilabilia salmonicolor]RCW30641.1 hypothetical protein DFO77_12178 [Marinilabilia salmonicolor]
MEKRSFIFVFLLTMALSLMTEHTQAIPSFARKYRLSCTTCHSPSVPKLKDYGDSFAGNGFRLEDEESPRFFVPAGDDKLSLIRDFPMAARFDGFLAQNVNNSERADFQSPYILKLLTGGELSDRISYYFYFLFYERGEIGGVEDAFLMYNNLFGIDFDVYLGQFQVSDPLFKRELRLTLEDYRPYIAQIGTSGINLSYDKGVMLTLGLETGTTIVGQIVNGNGIPEAENHVFDDDKYKDVLVRVSQGIGDQLSIGAFGYFGKEALANDAGEEITNEAFIFGPDITFAPSFMFEVNLQYILREDSEVFPDMGSANPMQDVLTNGAIAEIIYSPKGDNSNFYFAGLLNYVESDFDPADYKSYTLHTGYIARRNVRLAAEISLVDKNQQDPFGVFSLGFVSAF